MSSWHLNLLQFFFRAFTQAKLTPSMVNDNEMIACLLSAFLLRLHCSVLMVLLPIFKEGTSSQVGRFFLHADIFAE